MDDEDLILIDEFCSYHGITVTFVSALQDYGMVEIIVVNEKQYIPTSKLSAVEKIIRLHHELDINLEGIDVILTLLNRIDSLQHQMLSMQNRLDFFEKI